MGKSSRFLNISSDYNPFEKHIVKFNTTNEHHYNHNKQYHAVIQLKDEKDLAVTSYDYCQDLFSGLFCLLLLNPEDKIFKNKTGKDNLYFFLQIFLHFRFSPTQKEYSPKALSKMKSYANKLLIERENIFADNQQTINTHALEKIFVRLSLEFSILPENIRKDTIHYILSNLNVNPNTESKISQLKNKIFYYHTKKIEAEKNKRFNRFLKNYNNQNELNELENIQLFDGLFSITNNSVEICKNLDNFKNALNDLYKKYTKTQNTSNEIKEEKEAIKGQSLLEIIRKKIADGFINASDLKKLENAYKNETDPNKKNKKLVNFLYRAILKEEESKLDDDFWRRMLFHFLTTSAIALKMGGTLLLDSAFFFGVALIFGGFNINFLKGSSLSIAISFGIAAMALIMCYGAGLATWVSRVDKIRKKIRSLEYFSIQPIKSEFSEEEQHAKLKKTIKGVLLYFIAPIAALASGLPAFYGVLKTVSKLGNACNSYISESQTWLISIGFALAIGSAISFFCFYTFKMDKSIDTFFKKWEKEDKAFFLVAAAFTLILGMIYFFAIKGALSELSTFILKYKFTILKINNHLKITNDVISNLFQSHLFFGLLFGSLMLINLFTVIDYTSRLLKPSEPIVKKNKDNKSINISLNYEKETHKQENKQIFAKARYDLEKRPIFKLSIAIIDIAAFSCFGGAMCSNNILGSWNCAHFEKGKLVYNHGSFGSEIMMCASSIAVIMIIAALWHYRKSLQMTKSSAIISTIGFLLLLAVFFACPSSSSIFFAAIVILANIFVSLAFTHFVNTFLLETKINDADIIENPENLTDIEIGVFNKKTNLSSTRTISELVTIKNTLY